MILQDALHSFLRSAKLQGMLAVVRKVTAEWLLSYVINMSQCAGSFWC